MKRISIILALLAVLSGARAEGPDDQYILIYNLIQEADSLGNANQPGRALTKYLEAQTSLQRLQKGYADWNPKVVNFRMNYLATKVAAMAERVPPPPAPVPRSLTTQSTAAPDASLAQPAQPPPLNDWGNQLRALENQVRRLGEDKVSIEAKLKEALAAQPARSDPRELGKAEDRIKGLLKENDLLRVGLEQERAKPVPTSDKQALGDAQQALTKAKRSLAEQTRKAEALEKESTALQIKLNKLPPSSSNTDRIETTRKELEIANRKLTEQTKLASELAQEKEATQSRLKALKADSDAATLLRAENKVLKKQFAELKAAPRAAKSGTESRQLALAQAQIATLESDKEILRIEKITLESRVKQLSVTTASATAAAPSAKSENKSRVKKLQQERDDLKKQLDALAKEMKSDRAAASTAAPPPGKPEEANRVKKLQQERDDLKKQLDALAKEMKSDRAAASTAAPPPGKPEEAKRIKKLQQERDDLKKQLDAAAKELSRRNDKVAGARVVEMEKQVATLRSRLDVFEARQAPYTAEELALFRKPETKLVQTDVQADKKAAKELPPGTVALAAEAQRYFSAKQLDKAEDKYLQVLRQEQNHVPTLANLAAVELELNHLELAETNILQAVALAPDNATCLLLLGQLRLRQAQYDGSLDALSRAAKLEPRSAEVQNYLGLTLSAKGMRGPAETALRKAVQFEPGYGEAHNNLAVIYATQQPPLLELARWHYQKALAGGSSANPNLERLLNAKKATEGAQP
ncbi:MAG: hypothetical protein WCT12_17740 [Verrucomicrobiota bacterium]